MIGVIFFPSCVMKKRPQNLTNLRKWSTHGRSHVRRTDNHVKAKKVWPDRLTNYITVCALLERLRRAVALLIKASVYVILLKQRQQNNAYIQLPFFFSGWVVPLLPSPLVGVISVIEEDVTGSLTGDEALTFCNELDEVAILVKVLVGIVAVFVNWFVLIWSTCKQEIKQKGLLHFWEYFLVNIS